MGEKLFPRRRLTVVGEIRGQKRQKLAGIDFPYDLLRAKAPRFWPPAGEKPLHPIYYYPWEMTPRIGGR
jgi:starvation-inducible outer membrane lipoprotein